METRFHVWASLPLNLIGSINIMKMVFLPKLLYLLRASPIFRPKPLFQLIDSLKSSFISSKSHPRIARASLQAPTLRDSLACPNFYNFLASQLTYVYNWFHPDAPDPSPTLSSLWCLPGGSKMRFTVEYHRCVGNFPYGCLFFNMVHSREAPLWG